MIPAVAASPGAGRLRAFLELGKLRLSALAVFAVVAGLFLGYPGIPPLGLVLATTAGTFLVAAGGNALNMYLERDRDLLMDRTKGRPLPTGRLRPAEVLAFGLASGLGGLALLAAASNLLATAICGLIFVSYVMVYTPMKRLTHLNTLVGAVPGGLPPVVGYAAGAGLVDQKALLLFFILFFWQVPHFLAIAWRYREDYRRGGMQMLPVLDPAGTSTARQMIAYGMALVVSTLLAGVLEISGGLYLIVALFLGVLLMVPVLLGALLRTEATMRACFLATIVYLPLLFAAMVLDRAP